MKKSNVFMGSMLGTAALFVAAPLANAAGVPVFQPNDGEGGGSYVSFTHDPNITDGTAGVEVFRSVQGSSPTLNFNPGAVALPSNGSTRAKGGLGHFEDATKATAVIANFTGIDQVDPNHATGSSELLIQFELRWDIVGGNFGPPIVGSVNFTVGGTLGNGGTASVETQIRSRTFDDGIFTANARPFFNNTVNFTNNTGANRTFSQVISSPSQPFSPTSLNDQTGSGPTEFILEGFIRLRVNNDDGPSNIDITEGSQFIGMEIGAAGAVPLPSSAYAGLILGAALLGYRAIRRRGLSA